MPICTVCVALMMPCSMASCVQVPWPDGSPKWSVQVSQVGIEVDDGQRLALAEAGLRGLEQRQRNGMVTAQKHGMVLAHQRPGLALDVAAHLVQRRGVGQRVARIGQVGQRRHVEHGVDAITSTAGTADGLRPEAAPPVGHAPSWHTGQHERKPAAVSTKGRQPWSGCCGWRRQIHPCAHANIFRNRWKD